MINDINSPCVLGKRVFIPFTILPDVRVAHTFIYAPTNSMCSSSRRGSMVLPALPLLLARQLQDFVNC